MVIFKTDISVLNKFLKHFSKFFSKKQMSVFTFSVYSMFKEYKRNSLYEMARVSNIDYQKFQYFFSDSKWNLQSVKDKRLEIIQKQLTTASTKDGQLAIDDTGCPKPFAKKTQGAKWQHCGAVRRQETCNVAVVSAFVSKTKHFPVSIVPYLPKDEFDKGKYDPEFKSKITIAKELFDKALEKGIKFSAVTFDSWYASSEFIEYINSKDKTFYSEIKCNRNISMFHPHPGKKSYGIVKADELVTLIKKHDKDNISKIKFKASNGTEVCKRAYSFKAKLKGCAVPLKFVVVFDRWNKEDLKDSHILITNNLKASSKTIIQNYLLRWGVEHCIKELKDTFCFDQYQLRHINKIERYWNICLIAWTLTYWIKQNAYLNKIIEAKPRTFNEFKNAINSLLELSATNELSKNEIVANNYFKIKSARLRKKAA